ncbi:MAG: ABC transporter permease [Candidatus Hadarchaeaceae archaeon]
MRLLTFALKNLGRRKIRTGLTVFGIAIAIAAAFVLLSVNEGAGKVLAGAKKLGPDIEAKVKGTQVAYATDENYAAVLEEIRGVRKATPVIMWEYWHPEKPGFILLIAMIPSDAQEIYADIEVAKGRQLDDSDDFAVELGYQAARLNGLSVGDGLEFGGENFEVVGILEKTGSIVDILGVMPLWSIQSSLPGAENKASGIWIWVEEGVSAEEVMGAIEDNYPELRAMEGIAVLEYSEEFVKFSDAIRLIVMGVALLIGTLAAMNTVTMSTFERMREFGTIRSLGASGGYVFKLVLIESVLLCVIGGLLGCVLGYAGSVAVEHIILGMVGMDVVAATLKVLLISIAIAIGVGLIAGLYPARRVSKQQIVEALRYE